MGYMDAYPRVDLITEELERGGAKLKRILADLNQELSLYESAFAKEEKRWSFLVILTFSSSMLSKIYFFHDSYGFVFLSLFSSRLPTIPGIDCTCCCESSLNPAFSFA